MRYFLILVLLFGFVCAKEGEEGFHIPKDLSYLNLTGKQKEKIEKVLREHRKRLKKLHEKEEKLERDLEKSFVKDKFDKRAFFDKNLRLKRDMADAEADFFEKIHKILNKEQREKFVEYIEEWEIE